MLTLNSKALKIGNKWLTPINGSGPTPPSTTYYVTTSGSHGSVVASPTEGTTGTEVTLSNTPDTGYDFDSYTLTGATLKNANQFDIADSDVSVVGNFRAVVTYDHYEIQILPEVTSTTCNACINDINIRPYSGYVRRSATSVKDLSESDLDTMVNPNETYVIAITRSIGLFLLFSTLPANGITWYDTPVAYPTYWEGTVSGYLYGVDSNNNRTLLDSYGPTANRVHGMHTLGA